MIGNSTIFVTMILFFSFIVTAYSFDKGALKAGLQSASGQVRLYHQWQEQEQKAYTPEEDKERFRVFRSHLKEIVEINDSQEDYELDTNFMAGLTDEEQSKYYGINITDVEADTDAPELMLSSMPTAESKDWRAENKITAVKNQGSCGSCWAFGGIAAFEGHYAIKTGGLKRFSEQEFLDCTYSNRDGCKGGWYDDSFKMLVRTQHLSLEKDYKYRAKDGRCHTKSKPNGMKAAKCKRTVKIRGDNNLAKALLIGPLSMAFEIKGGFNYYKKGVLSVRNCGGTPHHAMAVTGYTADYWEIKNSWGTTWGDKGYVRFNRKIKNMCGISSWTAYPALEKTGSDTDDDVAPTESGQCKDIKPKCPEWKEKCKSKKYRGFMAKNCKETCGKCNDDEGDGKCPKGLKFCKGKCQHEHFCHM